MDKNILNIVSAHVNQGNFPEALSLLKKSEKNHINDAQYWEINALTHGMSGNNEGCLNSCLQAIKLNPGNIGTYINLGVAQQNLGMLDEAEATLKKALNMNSEHPQVQNNLGAIYILKTEYKKAKPYIEKAISINPNYSDAVSNLAEIYKNHQDYDLAIENYLKSLKLNPNNINSYIGLGILYTYLVRYDEAETYLNHAVKLNPNNTEAMFNLGFLHYQKKAYDQASSYFEHTLKIDPNHSNARYLLSAITGKESPDQSPEEYIKSLFDHYAETFDKHLVNDLGYSVPDTMYKIFTDNARPINTQHLLDLGCGTGLCGERFRTLYDHLTGIDLSELMIKKSNEKKIYDELHSSDISKYLEATFLKYDLTIAADVFIYIGNIAELVKTIYNRQNNGGYFIFSIETSSKHDTFHLRSTGRYSHNVHYIKKILDDAYYKIITSTPTIIRNEKGSGINGIIYLCQK